MTKRVVKIGNSHGIIFDNSFLDEARIKVGDQFNVTTHDNGTIMLTPLKPQPSRAAISKVIKATMNDYAGTMKKLA
jgi:antitoxin component of MazEF toxin-antitoxin module